MFTFYNGLLPSNFEHFFIPVKSIHTYNTSHITYLEQELIVASFILGLMAQKYGIQLEKTSNCPVRKHSVQRKILKLRGYINTY